MSLGPLNLVALPPLRFPKVIFLALDAPFAFAMLIGVVTGTYSSIFVGAPVLIDFAKDKPLGAAKEEKKKNVAPEL